MAVRAMLELRGAGRAALAGLIAAVAIGAGAGPAYAESNPVASYTFAPAKPLIGQPITFTSTATAGKKPIVLQAWDFDNDGHADAFGLTETDRKSTRLNSSHPSISYAVFCLKKKT